MSEENNEIRDPQGLLAAYNKAKEDLISLRAEYKELKEQADAFSSDEFRVRALSAEARLSLQAQGIKDVDRLMPYIGTDGLDFDEEGKVTGLTERLDTLKKDLPEVFDPKVRAAGKADIFANGPVEEKPDPFKSAIHNALNK